MGLLVVGHRVQVLFRLKLVVHYHCSKVPAFLGLLLRSRKWDFKSNVRDTCRLLKSECRSFEIWSVTLVVPIILFQIMQISNYYRISVVWSQWSSPRSLLYLWLSLKRNKLRWLLLDLWSLSGDLNRFLKIFLLTL